MAKRNNAYFNFCGEFFAPKRKPLMEDTERPYNGRTIKSRSMSFGVKDGGNLVFVESRDSVFDTIHTFSQDGEKLNVDWNDRLDPAIIEKVASYRKYVVNLGDRVEFITAYDMMEYLAAALPAYQGDIVVNGRYTIRPGSKGATFNKFEINGVYAADPGEKRHFILRADLFYNKDSIDKSELSSTGKVYVNAYIPMYVNKDEGEKFFPFTAVFNAGVYDMAKPKQKALYEYRNGYVDIKSKAMQHMMWELRVVDGAEEVAFDESHLTKKQLEQIELGIRTLDDFRPRGAIMGDRIKEYRLKEPILRDDFADGMVDAGYTAREFEELIFTPRTEESMAAVMKAAEAKAAAPFDADDDDDDDLF